MEVAACLWRWRRATGLERCVLAREGVGWHLSGTVLTLHEGGPAEARYDVTCDDEWRTRRVLVSVEDATCERTLSLEAADGVWRVEGREIAAVRGCLDVDLGWSPSTNTLPIRRLAVALGQSSGPVTAAWVRFPDLAVEPLEQEYTRLDERRWRYQSRGGAFSAVLEVDEHGLVIDYGDLWERVKG
jgi:hypothetical protein